MGQPDKAEAELMQAVQLFQLQGHIYPIVSKGYAYVRLQLYTSDQGELALLVRHLGGAAIKHNGRRHMWEVSKRPEVALALEKALPYLYGPKAAHAMVGLRWAEARRKQERLELVLELKALRRYKDPTQLELPAKIDA